MPLCFLISQMNVRKVSYTPKFFFKWRARFRSTPQAATDGETILGLHHQAVGQYNLLVGLLPNVKAQAHTSKIEVDPLRRI